MSPELWDEHEDDTDLVRDLRKQIKDSHKSRTEAEARAAAAEGKLNERTLAETLSAKGVNPKAAKWLLKDGIDPSDEAKVAAWLDENSDLFPASARGETPDSEEQGQPSVDQATQDRYVGIQRSLNRQAPADTNKFQQVDKSIPDDATPEQVLAAFRGAGI